MDSVKWKLKEYLDSHKLTAYALTKSADLSPNTIYTIARGDTNQVRLETLASLLSGLRKLTGQEVSLGDVLEHEVIGESTPKLKFDEQELDEESRLWLEADLAPPMEPYDWGDVDPNTLGKPILYVPGEGIMVVGGKDE